MLLFPRHDTVVDGGPHILLTSSIIVELYVDRLPVFGACCNALVCTAVTTSLVNTRHREVYGSYICPGEWLLLLIPVSVLLVPGDTSVGFTLCTMWLACFCFLHAWPPPPRTRADCTAPTTTTTHDAAQYRTIRTILASSMRKAGGRKCRLRPSASLSLTIPVVCCILCTANLSFERLP